MEEAEPRQKNDDAGDEEDCPGEGSESTNHDGKIGGRYGAEDQNDEANENEDDARENRQDREDRHADRSMARHWWRRVRCTHESPSGRIGVSL